MNRQVASAIALIVAAIFPHFVLFNINNFEVSLGLFGGLVFMALVIRVLPLVPLSLALGALFLLVGPPALLSRDLDTTRFLQTTALMILSVATVTIGATARLRREVIISRPVMRAARASLYTISLLSVVQVVTGLKGIDFFFNPFRGYQYLHPYDPRLGMVTVPRAEGFYLEPSYDAFMIGALAVVIVCVSGWSVPVVAAAFAGMLASQSVTGFLVAGVMICLLVIRARPVIVLGMVALVAVAWVTVGSYLIDRLSTIGQVGTSANYRLLAPLPAIGDILSQGIWGDPPGSIEQVLSRYGLQMAGVQATSLDNGYYVLPFYFGWFGMVALVVLCWWAIATVIRAPKGSRSWIVPVWIVGSLGFSGGIVAPEFAFMTLLAVVAFRVAREKEDENGSEAERDRGHLQRPPRPRTDASITRAAPGRRFV